ncbi:hypothetical protein KC367_g8000 [Hortaea werneckii]|nr:hypothetical protein KC358_g14396 [Hortaea werneckii]KAI6806473.1 hypothetical protein KC350_g14146 [Hortaea werneckii]KAI6813569.1 hypothetical protein KC342_g16771 [Hortaea werneckii]KAI6903710.1 hypothetical protein KC348_g15583 [Hortaea werneckii]KAI6924371.1 hypothetical protein KC341_g14102 [Hortaea werneckii]
MLLYSSLAFASAYFSLANAQAAGVGGAGAAGAAGAADPAAAGVAATSTTPAAVAGAATTTAAAAAGAATGAATASSGGTWPSDIVGTWSTKSNKTTTGPAFYDPLNEELIEPERTGISYSFTADGWYENAYYRAIPNPRDPKCPSAIMQWQHGNWVMNTTGSLQLTPIAVDGRQLMSSPCDYDDGVYTRYNQSETFERYSVYIDPYHNVLRLDLYQFDGSPMQPMYIRYQPPQMLPTSTLNPTSATASATGSSSNNDNKLRKRSERGLDENPFQNPSLKLGTLGGKDGTVHVVHHINADRLWWIGLAMTGVGGLLYLGPRRMGMPGGIQLR